MSGWTISELSARLQAGEITSEAIVTESIQRAKASSDQGVYVFLDAEGALAASRASDERRKKGMALGALDGIPYALEDRFCTKDMPTENGCRMLEGYRPLYDAKIVNRLRAEGAILLGKLATDGFLAGSAPTKHVVSVSKAVADGEIPFAICADTGGSAFCASAEAVVVTRLSDQQSDRFGLIAVAPSFDGVAAVTGNIEDAGLLIDVLSDSAAESLNLHECQAPRVADLDLLGSLQVASRAYRILSAVETASEMALYDGIRFGASTSDVESVDVRVSKTRGRFFSDDEKKTVLLGTALLMDGRRESCYLPARAHREETRRVFDVLLENADVIRLPFTEGVAFLPSYLGLSALLYDGVLLLSNGKNSRLLPDAARSGEGGAYGS